MRRLIAVALVVVAACGGGATTTSTSPAVAPSVAPSATAAPTPVPSPTASPDARTPFVVHIVASIDELAAGADPTEWFIREGGWFGAEGPGVEPLPIAAGLYAEALAIGVQALIDGTDPAAAVPAVVATRAALAALAPTAVGTPPPTPVPVKPISVKGKGAKNTKPFFVAAGDYTVTIRGTSDGNVIAGLTLRDKSDRISLFNELPYGKYTYDTIIYAVPAGEYFFEMEVDGAWIIRMAPFK